ncbi:DUF6809 family protein [Sporolactobacillus shoreae]|uniref:DUF6809 family protein n=1 Tax=Sporolactobacillus shoreae TaxID=1465501 RepID=UPI003BA8852C
MRHLKNCTSSFIRYPDQAKRIEKNYEILKEHLNKEDFVTVLYLTDETNLQLREVSLDSFIRGFQLGWRE